MSYNELIIKKMRDRDCLRTGLFLLAAGFWLLVSLACRKENADPEKTALFTEDSQKQSRIILEVEGAAFTNADFETYVRYAVGEKVSTLSAPALSRLYDDFVDEKIFLKRAEGQSVTLTEDEKSGYLKKLASAMGAEDQKTEPPGLDEKVLTERLLVEKYLNLVVKDIKVEDKETAAYYNQHKSDYLQPEKVQVSQILLASEGKASEVRDRLKGAGEEEFWAVARTDSVGPEASKGGRMGVFSVGQLPPELEKFIFPMKEGEISRVVESTYGYHIFRLDKKFEARLVTQADAAPSIRAKLLDQKRKQAIAAHLEELKASMDWKSFTEDLPFTYQRNER